MKDVNIRIAAENYYNPNASLRAEKFLNKIKNGELRKDILPNKYVNFTGIEEFKDYNNYFKFLNSRAGIFFINALKNI